MGPKIKQQAKEEASLALLVSLYRLVSDRLGHCCSCVLHHPLQFRVRWREIQGLACRFLLVIFPVRSASPASKGRALFAVYKCVLDLIGSIIVKKKTQYLKLNHSYILRMLQTTDVNPFNSCVTSD